MFVNEIYMAQGNKIVGKGIQLKCIFICNFRKMKKRRSFVDPVSKLAKIHKIMKSITIDVRERILLGGGKSLP